MTASPAPEDDDAPRTESRDSVFVEFTAEELDFTPRPIRESVLQHLPDQFRTTAGAGVIPKVAGAVPLAECLLEQARVMVKSRRYADAAPRIAEAEQLYQQAGHQIGLADCYHIAAQVHDGLGEPDKALELLRKEEEIRRRLAA